MKLLVVNRISRIQIRKLTMTHINSFTLLLKDLSCKLGVEAKTIKLNL
jgi:hypothetical protein